MSEMTQKKNISWIVQVGLFLILSLCFSAVPFIAGLVMNKSSIWLSTIVSWYALIIPVLFFFIAWILYRHECNYFVFAGRSWIAVGMWFLVQYVLGLLSGKAVVLRLLALPYILAGGMGFFAGSVIFVIGGVFFCIIGFRRPESISNSEKPLLARWSSIAFLVIIIVLIPLCIIMSSRLSHSTVQVSKVPTQDEIFDWIKDIYSFGVRRPGSEADQKAIVFLKNKFQEFGYKEVKEEPYVFDYWEPESFSLETKSGSEEAKKITCFYVPYSGFTSSEGISAEMVYMDKASQEDFNEKDVSGKIILVDIPPVFISWEQMKLFTFLAYDPNNTACDWKHPYPIGWMQKYMKFYKLAEEHKVAGIVSILEGYPDMGEFTYYAPYDGEFRHIPSLYIRESDGRRLKAALNEGKVTAKITLKANVAKRGGTTATVYAVLPGKSTTNLLIHSHHDAPWQSGVEDSSGVGMVLSLAQYYAKVPKENRNRTLIFMLTGSHMIGAPSNLDFSEKHRNDIMAHMLFDIAIEHIADDYNPPANPTGLVEPRGIFVTENPVIIGMLAQIVARYNIYRSLIFPTGSPLGVPTDAGHWHREGYRIISNISGPSWLFDKNDTLDRVARDQLVPLTKMYIELIDQMDRRSDLVLTFNLNVLTIILIGLFLTPVAMLSCWPRMRKES
ncbi:MAG: hypothetical protein SVW57_01260 [Thermodesulfobacteriota bacterium]|nr:hypothetical protein [Thermodesulfobacteriota bacterium]